MIDVRFEQFLNAPYPISVTEFGIVMEVRLLQFAKACSSILVIELGIVIVLSPLHSEYLLLVDYQYYTL